MATSRDSSPMEDITLCSICFEKFKTPRFLPCTHSFCHSCLSSYIAGVCKSTKPRLGFNCPLCREYIPIDGAFGEPEKWAKGFPENDVLEKVERESRQINCEACSRQSEEEDATDFCLFCMEYLCKLCTKYHKRCLITLHHKIVSVNDIKKLNITPIIGRENMCSIHQGRKIELFCNDHEEPCCALCVSIEHKKCESVDTINKTAGALKEILNHNFDSLSEDVHNLKDKLVLAKKEQERFVAEMDDKADQVAESTTNAFRDAIDHLQHLKNDYLTKITIAVKRNKEKYENCIDMLADGIQCTDYCYKNIEDARKCPDDTDMVVKYYKCKKVFDQLTNKKFTQIHIGFIERQNPILENINDLESLPDAVFSESVFDFKSDLRKVELSLIDQFNIDGFYIRDGLFLSNGESVLSGLPTRKRGCKLGSYGNCIFYDKNFAGIRSTHSLSEPFGMCEKAGELFVACHGFAYIEGISHSSFRKSRKISTNGSKNFGIAIWGYYLFCACNNKIVKRNQAGGKVTEYSTETGVKHIVATNNYIVFSNRRTHVVTAITDDGQTVWKYDSAHLKSPCGLDTDSDDNIYVAGKASDNVHVLSSEGNLIRIFENIPRPDFMKINKARNICCVCSNRKHIKLYEFT